MRTKNVLGFVGSATRDHYLPGARVVVRNGRALVQCASGVYSLSALGLVRPGAKISVDLRGLLAQSARTCFGGGAFNSLSAFKLIAPEMPVRYLDSGAPDRELRSKLESWSVATAFLGLREIPANVVLGKRDDKVIFKSPIHAASILDQAQTAKVGWLTRCNSVLANSVKDPPVMAHLAAAASHREMHLYVVLTTSLPPGFVCDTALPRSAGVFCSWDEAAHLFRNRNNYSRRTENARVALRAGG